MGNDDLVFRAELFNKEEGIWAEEDRDRKSDNGVDVWNDEKDEAAAAGEKTKSKD